MIRKAAYNEIGGMREYFRMGEDYDFSCLLEERFALAMIAQPLYRYRVRHDSRQLSQHSDIGLYLCASECSAHCRRNGMPDIIGDSPPPLETLLTNAAGKGIIPRNIVRRVAKNMLRQKRYKFLRAFLSADKLSGGGHWKLRLKLVYWSLTENRLGFWFSAFHHSKGETRQQ